MSKRKQNKPASGPKVLRVGIVQNGKIIEEQEVRKRESVTIGSGPRCTFHIDSDRLPKQFELFAFDGKTYFLHTDEPSMKGRIQIEDEQVSDFAGLESQGLVTRRGGRPAVILNEKSRGKVMMGDITILFQFKTVSPVPKLPQLPADVRGSFLSNLDTQFASIFVIVSLSMISIISYARTLPYVEPTSIEELSESYQRLIMPDREPTPVRKPQPKEVKEEPKEEVKEEPEKEDKPKKEQDKKASAEKEKKPLSEAERKAAEAARREAKRRKVAGRGLLKVLGAKREGDQGGALADVFDEGGGASSLADAFSGTKGVDIATEGGGGSRGAGGGDSVGVGKLGTKGGGDVSTGSKKETSVQGTLREEIPEVDGSLDSASIRRVLKRKSGAIKSCYDSALKRNPSLQGKMVISFEIDRNGRVRNVDFSGTLQSSSMESCIRRKTSAWRFPRPDGGSVFVDYPVVMVPSG